MDRASGSGVFARDPDALIDMIELELTDAIIKEETDRETVAVCARYLDRYSPDWQDDVSQDDMCVARTMLDTCRNRLCGSIHEALLQDVEAAEKAVKSRTAWRVEGTLREFPKFPPVQVWFDYPRHRVDDWGILKDLESESAAPAWQKASKKAKQKRDNKAVSDREKFENAVSNCNLGEPPTVQDLMNYYSDAGEPVVRKTILNRAKKFGFQLDRNNDTIVKSL